MAKGKFKKKKINRALLRQLIVYPEWEQFRLVIALAKKKKTKKGTLVKSIIEKYFADNYNAQQRQELTELYHKISENPNCDDYLELIQKK